ncbi:EscF/YscF/HrpA family type III secretion system needle major subunit [Burkholderia sp. Bp8986]|uniref:EscF/YscF/HrpA family type III secretion system needle major subunit n=1 Tax=Burkholderia sp. Bp8986 TaxID=2184550 RepID=UPI00163954C8
MNFNSISQTLSSSISESGNEFQEAMSGDMTDPSTWVHVQKYAAQYANEIGMESALISKFNQLIQSINQKI